MRVCSVTLSTVFSAATEVEPRSHSILFAKMVPENGVEPSRPCGHRILSPARLPVPPLGHIGRIALPDFSVQFPYVACRARYVPKWPKGNGLQNHHSSVRIRPAPPYSEGFISRNLLLRIPAHPGLGRQETVSSRDSFRG